jgi:hypothetical protein
MARPQRGTHRFTEEPAPAVFADTPRFPSPLLRQSEFPVRSTASHSCVQGSRSPSQELCRWRDKICDSRDLRFGGNPSVRSCLIENRGVKVLTLREILFVLPDTRAFQHSAPLVDLRIGGIRTDHKKHQLTPNDCAGRALTGSKRAPRLAMDRMSFA